MNDCLLVREELAVRSRCPLRQDKKISQAEDGTGEITQKAAQKTKI